MKTATTPAKVKKMLTEELAYMQDRKVRSGMAREIFEREDGSFITGAFVPAKGHQESVIEGARLVLRLEVFYPSDYTSKTGYKVAKREYINGLVKTLTA